MLVIIDGMNLAYRAWYSLPGSIRSGGVDEGTPLAGYLLLQHLISIVTDIGLEFCCKSASVPSVICWDCSGSSSRRKTLVADSGVVDRKYKGQRTENLTKEVVNAREAVGILSREFGKIHSRLGLSSPYFEADDLIALLADVAGNGVVVSRDTDFYQLLGTIVIYNPYTESYITEDTFVEEYGFKPAWWVLWKAIAGDQSDNWPGVPGMGPIRTTQYIQSLIALHCTAEDGIKQAVTRWGKIIEVGVELITIPFRHLAEPGPILETFGSINTALGDTTAFDWVIYFDTFGIQRLSILDASRIIR